MVANKYKAGSSDDRALAAHVRTGCDPEVNYRHTQRFPQSWVTDSSFGKHCIPFSTRGSKAHMLFYRFKNVCSGQLQHPKSLQMNTDDRLLDTLT